MEIGVILGDMPQTVPPNEHLDRLLRQVEAAQRNGFTFITIGQHFVYEDHRWLQPIPVLARIAGELDEHVKIATTIVQAPLANPIALAEELATLDILSGGRLHVGVGAGYREEEFVAMGVSYKDRFRLLKESLEIMRLMWTQDEVTYEGQIWKFGPVKTHIRPMQQPHPPIWLGAMSESGVKRSARLADGWPITPDLSQPEITRLLQIYEEERIKIGRPLVRHPIRREIVTGRSREHAFSKFEAMAKDRLMSYAAQSLATRDQNELDNSFRAVAEREAIIGTVDECIEAIAELASTLPIDPILIRAQWPTMSCAQVESFLDELGQDIVPAVREMESAKQLQVPTENRA